jgi:stage V sporulation protein AF
MSNSLGIIGGLLLSEFAVEAGWFVPDTIVYISFVTIAGYAQPSLEMGYAMKFGRLFLLILTHYLSYWGLIGGTIVLLLVFVFSKTLSGKGYFYPIIPFNLKEFGKLFIRPRVRNRGDE